MISALKLLFILSTELVSCNLVHQLVFMIWSMDLFVVLEHAGYRVPGDADATPVLGSTKG